MSTARFLVVLVAGALAGAAPVRAQTAQQLQALRNYPELIRLRIQQSGLTPDQIRERLRQAGYSPSLLDAFLQSDALRRPGGRDDITLQPGDSLHVPEYVPTVLVQGAVHSPTSVLYERGKGLDYYIGNAGGFTRFADEGRVSVRYANGSAKVKKGGFLFFGSSPKPGPGSTVFVPTKDPSEEGFDVTSFVRDPVGIAASVATVILVVDTGKLVEVHEKYPVDQGHRKV